MTDHDYYHIPVQGELEFERLPPIIVLVISGLLVSGVITYIIFILLHIRIPIQSPLYLFAIFGALLIKHSSVLEKHFHSKSLDSPEQLLPICFPFFALRAAYSIEKKKFFKMLPLMLVAAIGSFLSGFAQGFIIKIIRDHQDHIINMRLIYFMHGFMFCTTQPYFISSIFEGMENFVFFQYLLEGESLFINTMALTFLDIMRVWEESKTHEWHEVLVYIAVKLFGGIPIGALFGKLTSLIVIHLDFDASSVNMLIVTMAILIYNIGEVLVISPFITVTIFILFIIFDSKKFSKDTDEAIRTILDITQLIIDIFLALYCILQIIHITSPTVLDIFHFMLFNYVTLLISRFVVFAILYPIVRKMGYPYSFQTFVLILGWGSIMSTNILCMGLVFQHDLKSETAQILPYILFNYIASYVINSPGIGICIRRICYQPISQPKVANMNVVIKHFMEVRDKSVYVLKMNRFMADVNWKQVRDLTEIEHLYKNKNDHSESKSKAMILTPSCPFCAKEFKFNLHSQNSLDVKRETRKHIWNYMKTIIVRQYESGMVSKDALLHILNLFEETLKDDTFGTINIHKLENGFRRSKTLEVLKTVYKKCFSFQRCNILVPRKQCRRICYRIVMHKAFNIIMYILIVITSVPVFLDFSSANIPSMKYYVFTLCLTHILFLIFLVECILNILAYSWILIWRDGCRAYLRSFWHIIDIISLCSLLIEILMIWLYYYYKYSVFVTCYLIVRPFRCLRLFRFFSGKFPKIMAMAENQFEARLLSTYEIVKAIRETIAEFLIVMDRVIAPSDSRKEYYEKFVADCDGLYKLMLHVHMNYPWISTTVKTKQIISTCKYVMMDTLTNLKSLGYVDEIEYNALAVAIKAKETTQKSLKKIKSPHVVSLFFDITWMRIEDTNIGDYLYTRSSVRAFEQGYNFGLVGDYLDGVIIIIQGMLKIVYTPNETTSKNFRSYGILPIIDCLDDTDMDHAFEIYIFPGNTVGELNILTGRPYDCSVVCVTEVRAYFINIKYISEAFKLSPNPVTGLECMMWKHSILNLATTILLNSRIYEFSTYREIHVKLERALCPDLTGYETFAINNIIEDVLLLDGIVFDAFTRTIYKAPCHIPRCVVKIDIVYKKMYAKLIIIPIADLTDITLYQSEPRVVELISSDESRTFGPNVKKRKKKTKNKYDSTSGSMGSSMGGNSRSYTGRSSRKSLSHSIASTDENREF